MSIMPERKIRLTVEVDMDDPDTMRKLMESKVKVISDSKDTMEAVKTVVRYRATDILRLMLEYGILNVNAKDERGGTLLHMVADGSGDPEIAKVLIEAGIDVNHKSRNLCNDESALWCAIESGHEELVRILIEAGSDVRSIDCTLAAAGGYEKILRILIEAFSDLNNQEDITTTATRALWVAAEKNGNEEVVRILIEAGSNVNQKDDYGQIALMKAAGDGNEKVVRILIEAGSDMNHRDNRGFTALMWSAWCGHAQTTRILLENGADFTAKDSDGETALDRAKQWKKDEETIELLEYAARLHRSTLFIHSIEYLRNHRQEYEEEEVREYIPDHVMNGFFRNTIWKKEKLRRSKRRRK